MALASRQQQQRKESDLFTGASNRFAIGTLAERTIGYVLLVHLQDNDTAEATSAGVARGVIVNGQFEVPGFGQLKVPGLHGGSGSARGGSGSALGLSHSV